MATDRTKTRTRKNVRRKQKDWAGRFLSYFASTGNVHESCKKAKIGRRTVYDRKATDLEFKAAWEEAEVVAVEVMAGEARRRAVDGVLKPIFYRGKKCGSIREYSDSLLKFLMQAHDQKYREASRVTVVGDPVAPVQHEHKGTIGLVARIDEYAAAFASAADREEASPVPSDGAGKPVDPQRDQGGQHSPPG